MVLVRTVRIKTTLRGPTSFALSRPYAANVEEALFPQLRVDAQNRGCVKSHVWSVA